MKKEYVVWSEEYDKEEQRYFDKIQCRTTSKDNAMQLQQAIKADYPFKPCWIEKILAW